MADHLFSPEAVRRLLKFEMPRGACALGVDHDIERCFDLDDATKVRLQNGRIADIGKEISDYNCIDCGVFRIGPALVRELEAIEKVTGDCSLSDGVRALAARGVFYGCDVGDTRWIDVDTPEAFVRAEAMIRVFGDMLGDEPAAAGGIDAEGMELFAPTWVRAAEPYREEHFEIAQNHGDGLARMMSNESPYPPSKRVVEAIMQAAQRGNTYPTGAAELRRKLGKRDGLDESHVVLGAGSTELIDLVIRTFLAPGEEVLVSVPTFSMYEARTRVIGGIPVLVPMTEDHEFDVSGIVAAVTERTKVIFLCTPNNPTGNRISEAGMRRILRLGLPTVIDEAYHELGDTGESLAHLLSEFPNAMLVRTFSKAFGLAGLRLGYLLAHPAVIRLLMRAKIPWNISALTLAGAVAAIEDVEEFERRMGSLRAGRAFLEREIANIPGVSVISGDGNFVLVDVEATGMTSSAIVDAMLAEGVFIRSLAVHHAKRCFVRVTVGTSEQNQQCVRAMRKVVAAKQPRRPQLTLVGRAS